MTPDLKIEQRKIDALIPYVRNARTHSDEQVAQIAASIKEFGWTNPILVDGENGIIAGHGRLQAARKLGLDRVPVIELANLTEAQRRAYILADNRLALNAGWDFDMLAVELDELRDADFDLALLGFDQQELNDLIGTDKLGPPPGEGGSGTTMIAAEKNGRVSRLMELDPKYCDVIVRRWQNYTGNKATLEADGRSFDEIAAERLPEQ